MKKIFGALWWLLKSPFRFIRWLIRKIFNIFSSFISNLRKFLLEEPEDHPLGDTIQKIIQEPMLILEELNQLRKHLFRAVVGLALSIVLAFLFLTPILDWLTAPIGGLDELVAIEVTESVGVVMRVAFLSGFALASPYIAFELLLFAGPGLKRRDRILGIVAIPLMAVFFIAGILFSYYLMLPVALPVLLNFMGISTIPRPSSYIHFTTSIMFWIGISFQLPLVSYVLAAMKILKAKLLIDNWRVAMIAMAIIAAAITPTVDPINMLIVLLPLIVLYGLSIILAFIGAGKKPKAKTV